LIATAFEAGVNFIDTADVYSDGESERLVGAALKSLGRPREQVVVATKVRGRVGPGVNQVGLSRAHILASIDGSLQRLGLEHVDLYQIHGFDPAVEVRLAPEHVKALDDASALPAEYPGWMVEFQNARDPRGSGKMPTEAEIRAVMERVK
jgi:aryl-alcohol dehydrogenase-like predicted oxidoreductase